MAMRPRYARADLLYLRESPLVKKPDSLPSIDQWIDAIPHNPRTRTTLPHVDETEKSARRPTFGENRQPSARTLKNPEDIFLGPPKNSFGTGLSLRPGIKSVDGADKSQPAHDESRIKNDRHNSKEKPRRDRELDRLRDKNEDGDGVPLGPSSRPSGETVSRFKDRNGGDHNDTRDGDRRDGEGDISGRRTTSTRNRFDQPWFRDSDATESKDHNSAKDIDDRGWRESVVAQSRDWQRTSRVEKDPEWMNEATGRDSRGNHTQEDFQRWKAQMRAAATGDEKTEALVSPPASSHTQSNSVSQIVSPPVEPPEGFFGMWADKKDDKAIDGGSASSKPTSAKPKSSRFAGFFAPQNSAEVGSPPAPPAAQPSGKVTTTEDKEGFQRILQMLGTTSLTPQPDREAAPTRARPPPNSTNYAHSDSRMLRNEQAPTPPHSDHQSTESLKKNSISSDPQRPASKQNANPDSDFLLNLMQQRRTPFNEGQIYGRPYQSPKEMSSVLHEITAKSQTPKPRPNTGPPGFSEHERPYVQNQLDPRFQVEHPSRSHIESAPPNHFDPSTLQHREAYDRMQPEFLQRMQPPPNAPRDHIPMPGYPHPPPFWHNAGPLSQQQDSMPLPPPGIRGAMPPHSYHHPFPPNAGMPQQQPPPRGPPLPGSGPFSPEYNGAPMLPPGFGPPPGMQHLQQQSQQGLVGQQTQHGPHGPQQQQQQQQILQGMRHALLPQQQQQMPQGLPPQMTQSPYEGFDMNGRRPGPPGLPYGAFMK